MLKNTFLPEENSIHYMKILKYGEITKDFYKYHDLKD